LSDEAAERPAKELMHSESLRSFHARMV